jgi:hypothetical protein
MTSTHQCDIGWPFSPPKARTAHIIPNLSQQSLLSIVKLCNQGCTVMFKHKCCIIIDGGQIVMYGTKCPRTGLWLVPLTQTTNTTIPLQKKLYQPEQINNVHQTTTKQDFFTYLHQCLFSPTKATLIKAIHNDQLLGFLGLTAEAVQRFLPVSTATI